MCPPLSTRRRLIAAFSLVEVLVVVLVLALIVSAAVPMVFATISSTRLTSAGQSVAGHLSLARQLAQSRNESVEVRLYEYEDADSPGAARAFRAMSIMRVVSPDTVVAATANNELMEPLTDTFYLPSGVIFGDSTSMSPILKKIAPSADREQVIRRGQGAKYVAFRFTADGGTNLETAMTLNGYQPSQTYLTLVEEKVNGAQATDIPKNFYTVQIDPATGKTSTYRP